jgi:hypothetical protein
MQANRQDIVPVLLSNDNGNNLYRNHIIPTNIICMSEITNEELGRRRFQIQKEKSVENAYEKIRRAREQQWEYLSPQDREILKDVLGEIWTHTDRIRWETYSFSTLSGNDVELLIEIGKKIKDGQSTAETAAKSLDDILKHKI